jgi:hypothetical protein
MMNNTLMKEKLTQAIAKDTSRVNTSEAAKICGLPINQFADAKNRKWPNVLKPAQREGKRYYYRRCDVEDFVRHMKSTKPNKTYQTKIEPEESNATIASLIKSKVKIEKDILVLQEAHLHICKAIQHLRK